MVTTEPAWKPQINRTPRYEGALSQHPAVRATLRGLSALAGVVVSALAFLVVGLYATLMSCEGEETRGLCPDYAGLVPVLEWPIFVIAVCAPLAGGIVACVREQPRWLALGVVVAFVMLGLIALVSTGQSSFDWN